MPSVKFLVFKRRARVVAIIFLLGEIIPTYSYYMLKGLVYIIIIALFGCQPFFYAKYTKLNIYSSYDVRLVFNIKYMLSVCLASL